jgi:hypothetical protein
VIDVGRDKVQAIGQGLGSLGSGEGVIKGEERVEGEVGGVAREMSRDGKQGKPVVEEIKEDC